MAPQTRGGHIVYLVWKGMKNMYLCIFPQSLTPNKNSCSCMKITYLHIHIYTPLNFRVCAKWNFPAKCFKICKHISILNSNTQSCFFYLHYFLFWATLSPIISVLIYVNMENKVARNEKWKKKLWVFQYAFI